VALFLLPSLVLYLLFMLVPFIGTIRLSLSAWDGYQPNVDFIGLANYVVLFQDPEFWSSLSHNLIWAVLGTAGPILIGLPLAIVLSGNIRGRSLFRVIYFLPFVLPIVVIGTVWGWIYHPLFGPLNEGLKAVGLESIATGWLGNEETALVAVIAAAVWATFGFVVVIFLAALQGVDTDTIDAARVDGANAWQRTIHVLLPAIAPAFTFVVTVTLIGAFSLFDFVWVMTRGGPGNATEVLGGYSFKMAFQMNYEGYGSAISMVIALISLALAVVLLRVSERSRTNG
jgi:ABC-type sugar transport system permease subunit